MLRRCIALHCTAASPFDVLGIPEYANRRQVRAAYMKLAKQYHPDVNPDGAGKFIEVQEAYERALRRDYKKPASGAGQKGAEGAADGTHWEEPSQEGQQQQQRQQAYDEKLHNIRRDNLSFVDRLPPVLQVVARPVFEVVRIVAEWVALGVIFSFMILAFFVVVDVLVGRVKNHLHYDSPTHRLKRYLTSTLTAHEEEVRQQENAFESLLVTTMSEEMREIDMKDAEIRRHLEARGGLEATPQGGPHAAAAAAAAVPGGGGEAPMRPPNASSLDCY